MIITNFLTKYVTFKKHFIKALSLRTKWEDLCNPCKHNDRVGNKIQPVTDHYVRLDPVTKGLQVVAMVSHVVQVTSAIVYLSPVLNYRGTIEGANTSLFASRVIYGNENK